MTRSRPRQRPSSTPRWSPDGKLIAFSPTRGHNGGIFVVAPDGNGQNFPFDISRDALRVVTSRAESVSREIWLLRGPSS